MTALDVHAITASRPPRVLLYGQEGVGKTSLAAKFPSPVFLLTEDGIPRGEARRLLTIAAEKGIPPAVELLKRDGRSWRKL